ncbi:hypothetical protein M595_0858 [Lyngbya aestuarii BL J]|uniref:Uncharacterized protein n=2 Tax=Lyngbya aestuarii TaxID=118322 RepID=U7QMC8_9CYAN|nr:hypothetical protein M595_0858 [Lyngbya aestuarii BL J]
MSLSRGEAAVMMYLTLAYQGQASLDNPILKQETVPGSGEYVFRHIRMAGEPNFSFGPPTINVNVIPSYSDTWVQSAGNRGVNGRRLIDF